MLQPPGFEASDTSLVCKLNKALCGLKQAPRAWYERLTSTLLAFGFRSSKCDHSLFIYTKDNIYIYVLIYVGDIIITGTSYTVVSDLITQLNVQFALKQLVNIEFFLGIELKKLNNGSLKLSQSKYICELLSRENM